jgi:argininosuccinate lyase
MSKRLWGGRFAASLDARIDALNRSLPFDVRLYAEDIEGSIAWAGALRRAGVLTGKQHREVVKALKQVRREFDEQQFKELPTDEDIHTAVERRVTEIAGEAGKRLHTGRSRNDQVATDLLLWLKGACGALDEAAVAVMRALVGAADRAGDAAIPAYTHLQRAQPVLFAHHLLAYVEMLARDRDRLADVRKRADTMPLGCGAAVGTGVAIDRRALARDLGFARIAHNSLDAVGSRDAALEFLAAATILATHLSRLGEEIVLWASAEFRFVALDDSISTGSSLLPQKRNPDGAELARAKVGRVAGDFLALTTALKGLPLAYNKDLQEDKEACFDAFDSVAGVCAALAATLDGLKIDPERCAAALEGGHLLAVEIADHLVREGMPFRSAHEKVGELVRLADERGVDVAEVAAEEVGFRPTVRGALRSKKSIGGTAPGRVRNALASWRKKLNP